MQVDLQGRSCVQIGLRFRFEKLSLAINKIRCSGHTAMEPELKLVRELTKLSSLS